MKTTVQKIMFTICALALTLSAHVANAKKITNDEYQIITTKEDFGHKQDFIYLNVYNSKTLSYVLVPMSSTEYQAWLATMQNQCLE